MAWTSRAERDLSTTFVNRHLLFFLTTNTGSAYLPSIALQAHSQLLDLFPLTHTGLPYLLLTCPPSMSHLFALTHTGLPIPFPHLCLPPPSQAPLTELPAPRLPSIPLPTTPSPSLTSSLHSTSPPSQPLLCTSPPLPSLTPPLLPLPPPHTPLLHGPDQPVKPFPRQPEPTRRCGAVGGEARRQQPLGRHPVDGCRPFLSPSPHARRSRRGASTGRARRARVRVHEQQRQQGGREGARASATNRRARGDAKRVGGSIP